MNENNQDNILSSEKKMNLAPVSSDMVELSEQRAAELAKPFEREEPETKPAEATVETTIETTEEQLQAYADPLANFNPETVAEPVQQTTPEVYPTPTKPTFSAPQQEVQVVQVIEDNSAKRKMVNSAWIWSDSARIHYSFVICILVGYGYDSGIG